MIIEKYSFGVGDRFGKEGVAQLEAIAEMNRLGIEIVPVWNKSNREHTIIQSTQKSVLLEAEDAVRKTGWKKNYYVDADHIGLETVDAFIDYSNFFTIDVAHFIGKPADADSKNDFLMRYGSGTGKIIIPGITDTFEISTGFLQQIADKYLQAISEVSRIYEYICKKKGKDQFIAEVSMDETTNPQTPLELYFILAELKHKNVEVQTIAPKFSGLFAKGVDYIGDVTHFTREFEQDVAVIRYVIDTLGLPRSLKLSVHSGSDKFAIYPAIKAALRKFDAGIHVKTAGTNWLEEVTGLAKSGGEGLRIAKEIYAQSMLRYDELTGPYSTVLHIEREKLPPVSETDTWNAERFAGALEHDQKCSYYDPQFRQLIHVGYKIAAEMGDRFIKALENNRSIIEEQVRSNLLEKHLKPLFL